MLSFYIFLLNISLDWFHYNLDWFHGNLTALIKALTVAFNLAWLTHNKGIESFPTFIPFLFFRLSLRYLISYQNLIFREFLVMISCLLERIWLGSHSVGINICFLHFWKHSLQFLRVLLLWGFLPSWSYEFSHLNQIIASDSFKGGFSASWSSPKTGLSVWS